MAGFSSSVWDRVGSAHTLSKRTYAALITFWTAAGIGASAVAAWHSQGAEIGWGMMIGIFVISICGIIMALTSDNPIISLVGYAMVALPFGYMLGPVIALYTTASVVKVLAVTTSVVVVLGIAGAVHPGSLEHWGSFLFGALLILIFGHLLIPAAGYFGIPIEGALTFWDWVGVFVFSLYVIFDMNRAMRLERTHDNAIDSALAVYLDFVNLFIRLLSIMGQSSED